MKRISYVSRLFKVRNENLIKFKYEFILIIDRDLLNILLCLHQTSVMDSIGKDCIELKRQYEACFNAWYSESFLKNKNADMSICNSLFQEYQKCLKVAIKKNNIPLWELDKEILQAGTKANESGPS